MPVSELDAAFVRDVLRKRSAVALDASKDYLIEARLAPLVRERNLAGIDELVAKARGQNDLQTKIVEALVTHETSFFRDGAPFEALRTELLPRLVAARAQARSLTIWSAACSSGQEIYSIAMLVLEHFPLLARWPIRLVATDISQPIVDKAREARFSQLEVNRGLPAPLMLKYFERSGMHWTVREDVRRMVEFRTANLMEPIPASLRPDIVFMRNVLIYFERDAKRSILDGVRRAIAPDGGLFLGTAETTLNVADGWESATVGQATYYKVRR